MSQTSDVAATAGGTADTTRQPHVVVGYNREPAATAALRLAAEAAASRHCMLTVVHQLVGAEMPERYGPQSADRRRLDETTARMESDLIDLTGNRTPMHLVLTEEPVETELQTQVAGADLLVLGNHHRAWLLSRMFSSAPATAVRSFPCPVILVPAALGEIRHIVCGYDGSHAAIAAARWAAAEARRRGVTATAVCVSERTASPASADWSGVTGLGRVLDLVTAYGDPAAVLTEYAEPDGLAVLGREDSGLQHHSVIRRLTAHAEVPVAVVPEFWQDPV